MAGNVQDNDWMRQLETGVRAGYRTFLDGWESASAIIQEQVDAMDILNPTCTCKRHCDNGQLVMPTVVTDDEVSYPYSSQVAGTPSPFSPRTASANVKPPSQIASATSVPQVIK